jgi:hypothetical protein
MTVLYGYGVTISLNGDVKMLIGTVNSALRLERIYNLCAWMAERLNMTANRHDGTSRQCLQPRRFAGGIECPIVRTVVRFLNLAAKLSS